MASGFHVPILWKRKVKSLIKSNPQNALELFFEGYKKNKDPKRMKYGLELLLPESFKYIVNSFKNLEARESSGFLELMTSESFLSNVNGLDKESQELVLDQIVQNTILNLIKDETIEILVSRLDYTLAEIMYNRITDKLSEKEIISIIKIIKLWGKNKEEIQPLMLKNYLKKQNNPIEKYFHELAPNDRIRTIQTEQNKIIKSSTQFLIILPLFNTTTEDIKYLHDLQSSLPEKSKNALVDWYINQNISYLDFLQIYESKQDEKNRIFLISLLMKGISNKKYSAPDILHSLLTFKDTVTGHELLKRIALDKQLSQTEIILTLISKLENQIVDHSEFLQSEIEIHSSQNIELILTAYLNSKDEVQHKIYLPFLQKATKKNWKQMITYIAQTQGQISSSLASNLFSTLSNRIKRNIGNYIIDKNSINKFSFLFNDFEIFYPFLTTDKQISIVTRDQVLGYVNYHIRNNFSNIIQIGDKLTFSRHILSSMMDEIQLEMLLDTMISSSEFLKSWKEIFITRAYEVLPLTLNKYRKAPPRNQKKKDNLISLLKTLVKNEPILFWDLISDYPIQFVSKLSFKPILVYGFEVAIPNIGEVISRLSEAHLPIIIEQVLPEFVPSGSKILYSLFAFQDLGVTRDSTLQRVIIELIKLDEENLLLISLIRCAKIIENSTLTEFTSNLVSHLIGTYPVYSFSIIANHDLRSLFEAMSLFLSSLQSKEVAGLFLLVMPTFKSTQLEKLTLNKLYTLVDLNKNDISFFGRLVSKYEEEEFLDGGKIIFRKFFLKLIGRSPNLDFLIYKTLMNKTRSQSLLLPLLLSQTTTQLIERILLDPTSEKIEPKSLNLFINHFETNPPENPEDYFLSLYRKANKKEEIQEAILPILGEYCSWKNLSVLMELPEKEKFTRSYEKALAKFSSRFAIQSTRALKNIWSSGLKNIYSQTASTSSSLLQSHCPQCGNPVLEKQKNCGFCNQRLTCSICRKSVVQAKRDDIVQCPQCSNLFHRRHILESVKLKKNCPVCNVTLRENEVEALPTYNFFFH
ncbi:MAG: hypothetical protein ACW964_02005 [Candidatus Hodarchaeales archaeon]|jgi:hypothetical protein